MLPPDDCVEGCRGAVQVHVGQSAEDAVAVLDRRSSLESVGASTSLDAPPTRAALIVVR